MLRTLLLYLSKSMLAKKIVTDWPFAWQVASRFVAGENLVDAVEVIKELNQRGINATFDHLGEHTYTKADAENATIEITEILNVLEGTDLRSNVSIKLSQIGLNIAYDYCKNNLIRILRVCNASSNFIRIDMEDAQVLDDTLKLFTEMKVEHNFSCVGIVIQSYLNRSTNDLTRLLELGSKIRLCKGAYKEPHNIAFPKKKDVDANYDRLARMLIEQANNNQAVILSEDGRNPPIAALATHDETRINNAILFAKKIKLPQQALEFQMLYGIRRELQDRLVAEGYPVRVYVPFGKQWYPYFTRRLAERPANLWFFISNFFRK